MEARAPILVAAVLLFAGCGGGAETTNDAAYRAPAAESCVADVPEGFQGCLRSSGNAVIASSPCTAGGEPVSADAVRFYLDAGVGTGLEYEAATSFCDLDPSATMGEVVLAACVGEQVSYCGNPGQLQEEWKGLADVTFDAEDEPGSTAAR